MTLILLYILAALFIILTIYYWGVFSKFAFSKSQETNPKRLPVSVIVYARNNENDLRTIIPILLNQNYHQFELVIVNNASTDETLTLIKEYALLYPNIKVVDVINNETFWGNKKYALTLGVKASKYEYLVFVDANTKIVSANWLVQLTSHFTINKTIIISVNYYTKTKGFFNRFLRFDHVIQQMQSLSWSKISKPYSLNLQTIALKKEEFYKVNGFIQHMQKPFFTNEYFLHDAALVKNTIICEHEVAKNEINPLSSFKELFSFKKHQLQLLKDLNFGIRFKIKSFYFFQFLFNVTVIATICLLDFWYVGVALLFLKIFTSWYLFAKTSQKLNSKDLIWWYPILNIVYLIFQFQLFLKNLTIKRT